MATRAAARLAAAALGAWLVAPGAPRTASADEAGRDVCVSSYLETQRARQAGELLRAERGLEACARAECPGMIRRDCTQWLGELSSAIPSIILVARDAAGHDLLDATAVVDGRTAPLDGKPLRLDPGKHRVTVTVAGSAPNEQVILLTEGEKARSVTVTLATSGQDAAAPAPARPARRTVPTMTYVLGGVGAVAIGAGTYFAIRGAGDRSSAGCDRGCSDADFSRVNGEFVAADVALGLGVACVGAALAWWFFDRSDGRTSVALARF